MTYLDFEKPIGDLEGKLSELRAMEVEGNLDISGAIRKLEKEIKKLRKDIYGNLTRWQRVQLSRHPDRPYTLDYIEVIASEFIELHGDRLIRDDKAIVGGVAKIEGRNVMIIGHQKGRNLQQRQERNFGMPNPSGYRKALRLMKVAEKFDLPILTFIDTPGAYPGLEAEQRGQGEAIARNLKEMFMLRVPVICIVIGEGASGGAIGIGIGDRVLMLKNTWYSVISPESCSSILWRSWDYKEQAAEMLKLTSEDMVSMELIDGVIDEPVGGAHQAISVVAENIKKSFVELSDRLWKKSQEERINDRFEKWSKMGKYIEKRSP